MNFWTPSQKWTFEPQVYNELLNPNSKMNYWTPSQKWTFEPWTFEPQSKHEPFQLVLGNGTRIPDFLVQSQIFKGQGGGGLGLGHCLKKEIIFRNIFGKGITSFLGIFCGFIPNKPQNMLLYVKCLKKCLSKYFEPLFFGKCDLNLKNKALKI